MKLPISMDKLLHGKAVEWERLEFLKELDMTEGRSTGIPKILHAMETNGSPVPVFDFDEDHTFFMCRLPVHPQATMPEGLTLEVTPQAPDKYPTSARQVLEALVSAEQGLSRGELQQAAGLADREHFVVEHLRPMLTVGLVEMTIPDRPRSSKQKYRLTAKGLAVLNAEGKA